MLRAYVCPKCGPVLPKVTVHGVEICPRCYREVVLSDAEMVALPQRDRRGTEVRLTDR